MNKNNVYTVVGIFIPFIILSANISCKKLVEVPVPQNQLLTVTVFSDSSTIASALAGIYINMAGVYTLSFANGALDVYGGLSADEIYPTAPTTDINDFYKNSISTSNGVNTNYLWAPAYKNIYLINVAMESLKNAPVAERVKYRFLGELLVLRAYIYFNLVNSYGNVPLVMVSDYNISSKIGNTSGDSVYLQIEEDLTEAKGLFKQYGTLPAPLHANYYAACALLSKAYLFQSKWDQAKLEADTIINSGNFAILPDLSSVFLTGSKEAIWQLSPASAGYETVVGYNFVPSSVTATPKYVLTNMLMETFETGDLRQTNWVGTNRTTKGVFYNYPAKYKLRYDGNTFPLESLTLFRLAEIYLIRAEANAMSGNLIDACTDLNIVRRRSGLSTIDYGNITDFKTALIKERLVELFSEGANRWYDLKRWKLADSILGTEKTGWKPAAALFPIPLIELQNNNNLVQNSGY